MQHASARAAAEEALAVAVAQASPASRLEAALAEDDATLIALLAHGGTGSFTQLAHSSRDAGLAVAEIVAEVEHEATLAQAEAEECEAYFSDASFARSAGELGVAVGFGRIVVSELEVPTLSVSLL